LACTICGSDLHTICGRRTAHTPAVLGHEIVGQIVEFGPNASSIDAAGTQLKIHDRIVWTIVANCGRCYFCQHNLPQKCLKGYKYGHQAVSEESRWHGGFATHCYLLPGTHLVKVSEDISDLAAAPLSCATSTIAAAVRTAKLVGHETVLVIGAGMLGLTACAYAHSEYPWNLVFIEPSEHRRQLAKSFGATACVPPDTIQLNPDDAAIPFGFDAVFECSGTNSGALEALRLVRTGGRIVLVGAVFPSDPAPIVFEQLVRKQITIHGVHNYQIEDLLAAAEFMQKNHGKYPFEKLVSHSCKLEQIQEAIKLAQDPQNIRVAILP
jgi:alcohol dehydrogenase